MKAEWKIESAPIPYPLAIKTMEERVEAIKSGEKPELIWCLAHPPLYTAGTSAKEADLLDKNRFPVFKTGRGGEYTYHGPGQRVAYMMLDLGKRQQKPDLKRYVHDLEECIIKTLAHFAVKGERRQERIGIWVNSPAGEAKIAALGIRVRKWVSFHGIAINVNPDLTHFGGIVPCGINEYGVTSLEKLGAKASMNEVDKALKKSFEEVFGG